MFNLFKQQKKYPDFDVLNSFEKKDHYFLRIAQWDWLDKETVVVNDPHNPRLLTLDPWPQYVFIAANGQMTITQYVYFMADKYTGEIPKLLDKTIIEEIGTLVNYRVIEFVEKKQRPKPEFELPKSER